MGKSIQNVAVLIVGVGMITALVLPGRQTAQVIKAAGGAFQGSLKTAISGK